MRFTKKSEFMIISWPGKRINPFVFLFAFIIGIAAVWISGFKLTWIVLTLGLWFVLSALPVIVYSKISLSHFFLYVYTLLISIDISKAFLMSVGGVETVKYLFPRDVVLILMVGSWLFEVFSSIKPVKIYFHPILVPYFLLVCWSELSVVNAAVPHLTYFFVSTYFKWFLIFLSVSNILRSRKQLEVMLVILALSVFLQAFYVLLQSRLNVLLPIEGQKTTMNGRSLSFGTGITQLLRPSGTMHHPNVMGSYLVYCLPIFFSAVLMKKNLLSKIPFYVTLAVGLYCLLLSYSRGGWMGFALAVLSILLVAVFKKIIQAKTLVSIFLLIMILIGIFFPLWTPFMSRLTKPDDAATTSRITMLKQSYIMVKTHLLFGVGLGNYAEVGVNYLPDRSEAIRLVPKSIVHNRYAVQMAETGVIGLLLFVWLLFRIAKQAFKNVETTDPDIQAIALGLFGGLLGIMLAMMFDHFTDNSRSIMFWFFTGLIAALGHHFSSAKTLKAEKASHV